VIQGCLHLMKQDMVVVIVIGGILLIVILVFRSQDLPTGVVPSHKDGEPSWKPNVKMFFAVLQFGFWFGLSFMECIAGTLTLIILRLNSPSLTLCGGSPFSPPYLSSLRSSPSKADCTFPTLVSLSGPLLSWVQFSGGQLAGNFGDFMVGLGLGGVLVGELFNSHRPQSWQKLLISQSSNARMVLSRLAPVQVH